MLLTEDQIAIVDVESFRKKQMARDKEVEEARRVRVEARLRNEAMKLFGSAEKSDSKNPEKILNDQNRDRRRRSRSTDKDSRRIERGRTDDKDDEIRKRRRQQVLELMRDGTTHSMQQSNCITTETVKLGLKLTAAPITKSKPKGNLISGLFNSDENDGTPQKRQLIPLDYSDIMQIENIEVQRDLTTDKQNIPRDNIDNGQEKRLRDQEIIEKIPIQRNDLFSYPINWSSIQESGMLETAMRPWVVKKVSEYLGESDTTLIEFIMTKIRMGSKPDDLLEELTVVLDSETENFVTKLWRMLIFQCLRISAD
jgi:RNA-binding protein 25